MSKAFVGGWWVLGVVLLLLVCAVLYYRGNSFRAQAREELALVALEDVRAELGALGLELGAYKAQVLELDVIAKRYEEQKDAVNERVQGVVADLRADNVRLRKHWQGCKASLPGDSASASGFDEAAKLRAEAAGRIIGIGGECDAQIKGLQEVVRGYERR